MSETIGTIEVPEFQQTMYNINTDRWSPETVVGYVVHHYVPGPTQTFKTDEELANSGVEMRIKLCDGHWLIAFPKIKQHA